MPKKIKKAISTKKEDRDDIEKTSTSRWGKRSLFVFIAIGVALILLAPVVKFHILPDMKVAPEDLEQTTEYSGNVEILDLTTYAYDSYNLTVVDTYTASDVKGNELDIDFTETVTDSDSGVEMTFLEIPDHTFTIDRKTFEYTDDYHSGQWNFPIDVEKKDYTFWNNDIGRTSECFYIDTVKHVGVSTYEYQITEEGVFLPITAVVNDEDTATQMEAMGAVVTTNMDITFWVDPQTGITINLFKHQEIYLSFPDDSSFKVIEMDAGFSEDQIADSKEMAKEAQDNLALFGLYLPMIFTIGGAGLVIVAVSVTRPNWAAWGWGEDHISGDEDVTRTRLTWND